MAKHLILFFHGMGKHAENWSVEAWKALKTAYDGASSNGMFEHRFAPIEITYDSVFDAQRDSWSKQAANLTALFKDSGAPSAAINRIVDLHGSVGKDSFLTTHVLDVLLYCYFEIVRDQVHAEVIKQIQVALKKGMAQGGVLKWSIVAHSLGTSVAHYALHWLHQKSEDGGGNVSTRNLPPSTGLFVANVSKLLEKSPPALESMVRPSMQRTNGIFDYYLNARHLLDPIPKPNSFRPPYDWLDEATRGAVPPRFQQIEISELTGTNPHALEHYLANPKVHVPFFRALHDDPDFISDADAKAMYRAYEAKADARLKDELKLGGLRKDLEKLVSDTAPGIQGFLDAYEKFKLIAQL